MAKIGVTQDNVVPNLMNMIERGNWWDNLDDKEKGLAALEAFGEKAAPAGTLLDRFLREQTFGSGKMAIAILKVMKSMGSAAKPYEPVLKQYAALNAYPRASAEEVAEMRKIAQAALDAMANNTAEPAKPPQPEGVNEERRSHSAFGLAPPEARRRLPGDASASNAATNNAPDLSNQIAAQTADAVE